MSTSYTRTKEEAVKFEGVFYTPLPFARKALKYLERVIGPKWWTKGYRLWDMAAGTGNLEWFLPIGAVIAKEAAALGIINSVAADQ